MMQIDVQDLVFSYGGADVLQGVSFCADKGERIAVLGPNVEERPACRLFVYRVARDFGGDSMRYVWDRNAEKVTL